MCGVIANHDPLRFRQVSRSLRIAGQSTTVRLEHAFWAVLDEIAEDEGTTTARLVSTLHEEALECHDEMSNFASLLRTVCLLYREGRTAAGRG